MDIWFYTLDYNPGILFIPFSNCFTIGHWTLFQFAPGTHISSVFACVCVCLSTFLLSDTTRYSRLILYIHCCSFRITHVFKEPWSLLLENLDGRFAHCHWSVTASRSSQHRVWKYVYVWIVTPMFFIKYFLNFFEYRPKILLKILFNISQNISIPWNQVTTWYYSNSIHVSGFQQILPTIVIIISYTYQLGAVLVWRVGW